MVDINDVENDVRDFLLFCKMNVANLRWYYTTDKRGTTLHINFFRTGRLIQLPEGFMGGIESIRDKHGINIEVSND